ncbi:MAG: thymidine kinase [Caedibacter sp. 37-49]|nr:MAG: thymidine kinase [Caedibacter sp. 37-49]
MAKLHFYYSAMNAGKTTTLLQSDYNYRERGLQTLLFTPDFDNRYEEGWIASRIGLKSPAITYSSEFNFFAFFKNKLKGISCILIDEAHFLTKIQVKQLCLIVDQLDIPVLTYGLRTDFKGEPFEGSKYLLALAEHLIEIKTICHCGRKAIMNQRVDSEGNVLLEGDQVEIGGNERYISLCRKHFLQNEKCFIVD